jgi:hypothetical protein
MQLGAVLKFHKALFIDNSYCPNYDFDLLDFDIVDLSDIDIVDNIVDEINFRDNLVFGFGHRLNFDDMIVGSC